MTIYPIYLPEFLVKNLIKKYCSDEYYKHVVNNFYRSCTKFTFYGDLNETGEVSVRIHEQSDDGFCISSGTSFSTIIKTFDEIELQELKKQKMYELAEEEFEKREDEERRRKINNIMKEMFPNDVTSYREN